MPPPKLIRGAKPQLKNGSLFLLGFEEDQKPQEEDIRHLFTDHEGFLWIATSGGLYRYDGENLLSYLTYPVGKYDFGMAEDALGNIWMGDDNGGITVLDIKAGILKQSAHSQGLGSLRITRLMTDRQQRIWAVSWSDGVDIIDPETLTVKRLDKSNGLVLPNGSSASTIDKNGNIWINARGGGVNIIDLKNKKIKYLDKTHGLKTEADGGLYCDYTGRMWVGLRGGLINIVDLQKNAVQTISEVQSAAPNAAVPGFVQDKKGNVWINTVTNGLEIMSPEKRVTVRLRKSNGLISDNVNDIGKDGQGQLWIATSSGLNMVSDNEAVVDHIGKDSINALTEDGQGFIWKATLHGIDILDRKKMTSRHLGIKQGLANDRTYNIADIKGETFIATDSGLDIIDTTKKTITHIGKKQGLSNNTINFTLMDKAGRIWIAVANGIDVYDPQNKTVKHLGRPQGLIDTRDGSESIIDFMCLDRQGRVWISLFYGGIDVIDPETGSIRNLNNLQGLRDIADKELLPDDKGNIWIGTDRGVYIADLENQTLTSISEAQGVIKNQLFSLLKYHGRVYAGTNKGITVVTPPAAGISSPKNWQLSSFGLSKMYIDNYNGDLITKDGLYWSGDLGIIQLDLAKKDTLKSASYITGISVFDRPMRFLDRSRFNSSFTDTLWEENGEKYYLKGQTPANTGYALNSGLKWDTVTGPANMPVNLEIPYNQNFIQFHYSTYNLTSHDTTTYKYILLGTDKKWSDPTSDISTINYMNLQPGGYTFEVICRNSDNVWSAPAKLSFVITPPWWQTWWAYTFYVLLSAGTIWSVVYARSSQLIKEKRILEQKVRVRTNEVIQQKEEIEAQRDDLEKQRNNLKKTVSELKSTQTQLIQSEKMASLGELTAGIAHEIQNPLNFVNNFSEVNHEMIGELEEALKSGNIAEALAIAADIKQNEQKINHHGKRADSIVKGMLQHSRSGSGSKEPTNVNSLADEYMRLSYHGLRAKDKSFNAEMVTNFDPGLPKVDLLQQDMGRVLLNLFNNAFYAVNQKAKTAPEGYKPEVVLSTSTENGQVIIKVKDNGIGIPDAIKEKIMQPFFTTKPAGEDRFRPVINL